jgi:peptidoglycan LD-endopeptidase LytH
MKINLKLIMTLAAFIGVIIAYFLFRNPNIISGSSRDIRVVAWIQNPTAHPEWAVKAKQRCGSASFIMPTNGYIGYIWGDTFKPGSPHQGLDIFGGTDVGITPVYAVYDGYLTRLPEWRSSVIIRIPSDPLLPERQIWTYYTHMANPNGSPFVSPNFPAGSKEIFVTAGTFLGYQGNYSGDPDNPVGVHLHFSIALDDGNGKFRDEREIKNTLDPSPYFGMALATSQNKGEIPQCP